MFPCYLNEYKAAAAELSKDDALCRFVMLMSEAIRDRENISADIKELELPHTADGSYSLKHEMLSALFMCANADEQYRLYTVVDMLLWEIS